MRRNEPQLELWFLPLSFAPATARTHEMMKIATSHERYLPDFETYVRKVII
jgi:hypothetical protein